MGNAKGDGYEKIELPKDTIVPPKDTETGNAVEISPAGVELIQHFEGCYLHAYQDSVGVWTIGWGRIVYPGGQEVRKGDTCTQAQADAWMREDIEKEGSKYVRAYVKVPLAQREFDALASFTYNRGAGRLRSLVNSVALYEKFWREALMKNLVTYNWAGNEHKYLLGLDRRRWAERMLFEGKPWEQLKDIEWFKKFKARGYK
jgi:lysozyme